MSKLDSRPDAHFSFIIFFESGVSLLPVTIKYGCNEIAYVYVA